FFLKKQVDDDFFTVFLKNHQNVTYSGKKCVQLRGDRISLRQRRKFVFAGVLRGFSQDHERIKNTQLVIDQQPILHVPGIQNLAVSYKSVGYDHGIVNAQSVPLSHQQPSPMGFESHGKRRIFVRTRLFGLIE
ncbi:MAG: hypothetical protein ACOC7W_08920, partial [Desulfosalsimonas sp.]